MKVKELIKQLECFDPELRVTLYSEDSDKVVGMDILDIDVTDGELMRTEEGNPTIRFGKSEHSVKFLGVNISSDT